ncbi:hypothetical protein HOP61_21790, partial [Halomonas daqingensis]|nr:hypothetical protein [Halomonas desiderata]
MGSIKQANQRVESIVEVTQQNAALVEEATAASHSLSDQARELARLVQRFKIE